MWYTGIGQNWQIGLATSQDGIYWTKSNADPVLRPGAPGDFDSQHVYYGMVLFHENQYLMWYSGSNGANWQIGLATSPDGVHWAKYAGNPVVQIGTPGAWDAANVRGASVLREGNLFKMWYAGQNDNSGLASGYAESFDGIHWAKHPGSPVLEAAPNTWEEGTAGISTVLLSGGIYHARYGSRNQPPIQIGYATSNDGVLWQKHDGNPVMVPGNSGTWDDGSLGGLWVLWEDNLYKMWYGGYSNSHGAWQIGYAESAAGEADDFALQFDGSEFHFEGLLDEVRVWNVARTAGEIQDHMHRALTGSEPGLIGYWRLDEGAGQFIQDSSPSGFHGHLGSSPQSDASDPTWVLANRDAGGCTGIPLPAAEAYGNLNDQHQSHPDKVSYCFPGQSGDKFLTFEVFDIDQPDEVDPLLNGAQVLDIPVTANNGWSGLIGVLLSDAQMHDAQDNALVFDNAKNPPNSWRWGVRRVSVDPFYALPSPAAYGRIRNGDQTHVDKVVYFFSGRPGDLSLSYEVYDLDHNYEVEVWLNGAKIHEVATTPNESWSAARTLLLPDERVYDNAINVLIFENTQNPPREWFWGVRNVRVAPGAGSSIALNATMAMSVSGSGI